MNATRRNGVAVHGAVGQLESPTIDQLPPHDADAEKAILGCWINNPETGRQIASSLSKHSFYDLRHQLIYRALVQMDKSGVAIDILTLSDWLKQAGDFDQIGGFAYLSEITADQLPKQNLPNWIDIIREHYDRRNLAQSCQNTLARIYDPAVKLADLKASMLAASEKVLSENSDKLPDMVDAAEFLATEIEPLIELVAGILHRASKLVFGGGSKSFKTWCLLYLALCVAVGADWLGRKTTKGKVLFVNFEIQRKPWQGRISSVAKAAGIRPQPGDMTTWTLRGHAADFRKLIPKIIDRCRTENFALIVLDPVYKLYADGTNENATGDIAALLNEIERLAVETGAAIAFGAHFSKGNASAKEAIDRISGSGVFARDPDSILIFTQHEEADAFTIEPILRNFAPVSPFAVRWEFPLMRLADDLDPSKLKQVVGRKKGHDPKQLLAIISNNDAANPISVSEWARLAEMPRKTLDGYLAEMRQKNWIKTIGEGIRAKQAITNEGKAFISK